jgi:hypothetical protein
VLTPEDLALKSPATTPLHQILDLLALAPDTVWHSVALLSFFCVVSYLTRTALMIEAPRSIIVHMTVCTLTLLPAIVLAAVLVWAAHQYPERAWLNLGFAGIVYVAWYLGGALTRLARPDTEGGDIGWLFMGALITFPAGAIAALIF